MTPIVIGLGILACLIFRVAYRDYRRGFVVYKDITIHYDDAPREFWSRIGLRLLIAAVMLLFAVGDILVASHLVDAPYSLSPKLKLYLESAFLAVIAVFGVRCVRNALQNGTVFFLRRGAMPLRYYRGENPAGYWALMTFYVLTCTICGGLSVAGFYMASRGIP